MAISSSLSPEARVRMPFAGGALRWLRALVVGTLVSVLTLAAHAAGGATPADWRTGGLLLPVSVLGSAVFLGRERGRAAVLTLVVGGQAVLHCALAAAPEVLGTARTGPAQGLRHVVDHLGELGTARGLAMAGAHLVVSLVVGLWLARGERALWAVLALGARVASFIAVVLRLAGEPIAGPARCPDDRGVGGTVSRIELVVVGRHVRRGPPPVLAA